MSGDGGTIRSVVSKSIKTTSKTPSSFARPYLRPRKTDKGKPSGELTETPPCPPRPSDLAGSCGQAEQRLPPAEDRPQRRCEHTWSRGFRRRFSQPPLPVTEGSGNSYL